MAKKEDQWDFVSVELKRTASHQTKSIKALEWYV